MGVSIRKRDAKDPQIAWLSRAERLLFEAVRSIRLLGSVVPRNAQAERVRLTAAFEAGQVTQPRWTYARSDHGLLRKALASAASRLASEPQPIAHLYAARARELEIEAAIASEAGTAVLGALARSRFRSSDREAAGEATILARKWISEGREAVEPTADQLTASDSTGEGSLLTRMREEVGRLRLPFAVVVQPSLSALAATGERHILVAANRLVTKDDVERTVMHEIEAHAIPRTRAQSARFAIFQIGTARGIDDQEGLALLLEERGEFLSPRRKRELSARHLAVEAMDGGASYADAVQALIKEHGLGAREAVMVGERAFRGGDGSSPGLGRERVYLEAFLRVKAHLDKRPIDESVLTSGQVGIEAIDTLAPYVRKFRGTEPPHPT